MQQTVQASLGWARPPIVALGDIYPTGGVTTLQAAGPGTALQRTMAQQAGAAVINNATGPAVALVPNGRILALGLLGLIALGYVYRHPKGILE